MPTWRGDGALGESTREYPEGDLKESGAVITCPQCGQLNRPGSPACAMCGTPLPAIPPAAAASADDGLPPWLRELQGGQAGQPGPAPSAGYGQYGQPPASPYARPYAAQGAQNAPGGYQQPPQPGYGAPPRGFAPTGQTGQMPQDFGQVPQGYGQPPRNMQASDLISADDLPEWLRPIASGPLAAPQAPYPGANGTGGLGGYSPPPAATGRGAPPGYGQPGYGQPGAPAGMRYPPNAGNGAGPVVSGPLGSGQLGFGQPASALFDESAFPDWLRQASMGQEIEAPPPARQQPGAPPTYQGYGAPGGTSPFGAGGAGYAGNNGYQAPGQRPQPAPQPAGGTPGSAFPSLDQAGAYRPALAPDSGVAGRSLLDPSGLPAWLGGQPGAPASSMNGRPSNPGGMPAQSLVDESALPQWLRAEPNTPAAPPAPVYGAPAANGFPLAPTAPAGQGMSGLLGAPATAEPLPQWLDKVYADANVQRIEPRPAGAPVAGRDSGRLAMPGYDAAGYGAPAGHQAGNNSPNLTGGAVSASDFVDESALPDWLKSQGAVDPMPGIAAHSPQPMPPTPSPAPPSAYSPAAPMRPVSAGLPDGTVPEHRVAPVYRPAGDAGGGPTSRYAASDLIDPSALPAWVTSQNPAPEASFSSASGWTVKQPAASPMQQDYTPDASMDYAEAEYGAAQPGSGRLSYQQPRPDDSYDSFEEPRGYAGGYAAGYGRMPDDELERSGGAGNGTNGIGNRRGPPIPSNELPPWLHGMHAASDGGDLYDDDNAMGQPDDDMSWDDGARADAPQWQDWDDDGSYAGNGYANANGYARQDEYAQYDNYDGADSAQERRGGGWRRMFGRK